MKEEKIPSCKNLGLSSSSSKVLSQEELLEHGMNTSTVHVDFMIGSNKMDIDGIKQDGTVVPIFRNGDWAF